MDHLRQQPFFPGDSRRRLRPGTKRTRDFAVSQAGQYAADELPLVLGARLPDDTQELTTMHTNLACAPACRHVPSAASTVAAAADGVGVSVKAAGMDRAARVAATVR